MPKKQVLVERIQTYTEEWASDFNTLHLNKLEEIQSVLEPGITPDDEISDMLKKRRERIKSKYKKAVRYHIKISTSKELALYLHSNRRKS